MLAGLDVEAFTSALRGARWRWFAPMMALQVGIHAVRTRLFQLLIQPRVAYGPLFSLNAISNLAINVVPGRMGELARPALLREQHGVPLGASFAAIFLGRLLDVLMLLLLLLWVGLFVELPPQGLEVAGVDVIAVGQRLGGLAALGGGAVVLTLTALGEPALAALEPHLPGRLSGFLGAFVRGARRLWAEPSLAARALALSASAWTLTLGVVLCGAMAFDGVPATLPMAATVWAVTITGTLIAPTPGFFGSYEAFCLGAVMLWGVDRATGSAFALSLHLGQLGFILCFGAAFLVREGLSLSGLVALSQTTPPPGAPP